MAAEAPMPWNTVVKLTLVLVLVDENPPLLLAGRALHGLLVDLEHRLGVARLRKFWEGGLEVLVHLIVEPEWREADQDKQAWKATGEERQQRSETRPTT